MNPSTPEKDVNQHLNLILQHKNAELELEIEKLLKTEEKVAKAKHLYAFLSQVNQNIVRIKDESRLFYNSCQIAIEFGKFRMAWVGIFENLNTSINLVEQSGIPENEIKNFTGTTFDVKGPQAYVLRTDSYYLCNDIQHSLELDSWKPFAASYGIQSCMVLPIRKGGIIIGTLNLYSIELNFSFDEEIALLNELAKDISFALDLFEKDKRHKITDTLLKQNENRFRSLIEKGTDMIILKSNEGKLLYVSPSVTKIFGYSVQELLTNYDSDFIHPDDVSGFMKQTEVILKNEGSSFFCQQRYRHKNGNWIWCEGTITNLLQEPGIHALVSNFRDISDKKAKEKEQEFERNNLEAIINNTSDLMWSVDQDYKLITSNAAFDELVKLMSGKQIAKGSNVLSIGFSSDQIEKFKKFYIRAFKGETFTEIEHSGLPIDLWSEISFYPIRNGNEIVGTACYSRDITESKKAEQELKHSELFNRGILNSLTSDIAVIDDTGDIIAVNEAWKKFALENGEVTLARTGVGSNYFNVCQKAVISGEELGGKALQGMLDVMGDKIPFFYLEYPCHSPTEQRWFGMRVMKFVSDKQMVVVSHENISERVFAEQELQKREAGLKEAQRIAKIGNWQLDLLTHIHSWSDELFEIFEIDKEKAELSTDLYLSFIHPDDLVNVNKAIIDSNKFLKPSSTEFRFLTRTGKLRYGYAERKFGFDKDGIPIRLYGILQDVTERKTNEIKLEEQNNQLIKTNFELDRFVYSVSHDLRAPLSSTLGLLHFIETESKEEDTLKYAKMIHTSITRLDVFIKNILSYSHSNRAEINVEHIPVQESIVEIVNSLRNMKEAGEIDIEIDVNEEVFFYSEVIGFRIILENIISNAIKYQNHDRKDQLIRIRGNSDIDALHLTISDNGIGIPSEYHKKVFDMFFRLPSSKAGTGIGLYVVKGIIEKLQGSIVISSEAGVGTTFGITIKNLIQQKNHQT